MLKVLPRTVNSTKDLWTGLLHTRWYSYLGAGILGLFLARAVVMGELYPFGVAFLAALCVSHPGPARIALIGVVLGTLLTIEGSSMVGYLISIGVVYVVLYRYNKEDYHWLTIPALVFAIHLLARGSVILIMDNRLYQWIGLAFESFFTGVLTLVAITGVQSYPKALHGFTLTTEEKTSMGLLILGILVGLGQVAVWKLGIQSVISRLLVLWGGLLAGPGGGAAVGVAVGIVPSIQGTLTTGPIAFYALAGLLGGVFNTFRKAGVIVGFTLANLILSLFFTEQVAILDTLKETAVASLLFILFQVPQGKQQYLKYEQKTDDYSKSTKLHTADKLQKIAQVFGELRTVFEIQEKNKKETNELNVLFNKVASQVCEKCSLHRVCWEQDFYKTYRAMLEACTKLESAGSISEKEFGTDLKRRCVRLRELSVALNSQLELLKLINSYEKQLAECRELINNQLNGVANIIQDFSEELKTEVRCDTNLSSYLKEKLKEKGIEVDEITVIDLADGEKEIHIMQTHCPEKNWCKSLVAPNISQVLGKTYVLKSQECRSLGQNGSCSYHLVPSRAMQMNVGKAQSPKEGVAVSGDICSALTLPNHRFALILVDGMGVGPEAHAESTVAVNLLEKLLLTGLPPELAVRTVNTALYIRSPKEKFVTLDVVIVNQINGQADFIKMGGAPTFLRSAKGIKIIRASSPPAGILQNIEVETIRHVLLPGNIILMMSDGIWDVLYNTDGPAGWFEDLLTQLEYTDPQQIANYILFLAKKAAGNKALDDMSIQVARIEQREIA